MTRQFLFALGAIALVAATPARADDTGPASQVTAVSVIATPGHAEIVIAVQGAVDIRDFVLREPDRLVVDVVGATLQRTGAGYDGVARAGITDIRYSQFRPDVVRIAIYLDGSKDYRVEKSGDAVRIRFGADAGLPLLVQRSARRDAAAPGGEDGVTSGAGGQPAGRTGGHAGGICHGAGGAYHGNVGSRQHRGCDRGLRRVLRSYHHPRQGSEERSHGGDQEPALDRSLRGGAGHAGSSGDRAAGRHHPGGLARCAGRARFHRAADHAYAAGELRQREPVAPQRQVDPLQARQCRVRHHDQLTDRQRDAGGGSPTCRNS